MIFEIIIIYSFMNSNEDVDGRDSLLDDVLNDIASQSMKEKNLFKKSLNTVSEENIASSDEPESNDVVAPYSEIEYESHPDVQYSPMEVLKHSLKWSLVVAGILFLFHQKSVLGNITTYVPNMFVTVSTNMSHHTLNNWGNLFISFLGAFIFFVLYHWVL